MDTALLDTLKKRAKDLRGAIISRYENALDPDGITCKRTHIDEDNPSVMCAMGKVIPEPSSFDGVVSVLGASVLSKEDAIELFYNSLDIIKDVAMLPECTLLVWLTRDMYEQARRLPGFHD